MTRIIPVVLFLSFLGAPVLCPSALGAPQEIQNEDCLTCHDKIDPAKYARSIHGKNLCTSCHVKSARKRPGIPIESGHPFRCKAATYSD